MTTKGTLSAQGAKIEPPNFDYDASKEGLPQNIGEAIDAFYGATGKRRNSNSDQVTVRPKSEIELGNRDIGFELTTFIPDIQISDLSVKIIDGEWLTVSEQSEINNGQSHSYPEAQERYSETLSQSFWLAPNLDTRQIQAVFHNGIFKVQIPWIENEPSPG